MKSFHLRSSDLAIEFNKQLARLHLLAIVHINGLHDGHLIGLDDLGLTAWHYLACRRGHDIDLADTGPDQRERREEHDRPLDITWRRMDGLFLQRQSSGQKLNFVT
ncbi:hypothetical protein D3C80_1796050 [compost metagenome]